MSLAAKSLGFLLLILISCKGADDKPAEAEPSPDAAQGASLGQSADGEPAPEGETPDIAETPVMVTGTYLTCSDLPVTRGYNAHRRVGCRMVDRSTGQQVAMERLAKDWEWVVDAPDGVETFIDDRERSLYPIILVFRGEGVYGERPLATVVSLRMDLIVEVDGSTEFTASVTLSDVLEPWEKDDIGSILTPPTEPVEPQLPESNPVSPEVPQTPLTPATQTPSTPSTQTPEEPVSDLTPPVGEPAALPDRVRVAVTASSTATGLQLRMVPEALTGIAVTEEVFRVTGDIRVTAASGGYDWEFPVAVSFNIGGEKDCSGEGRAGSVTQVVEALCR